MPAGAALQRVTGALEASGKNIVWRGLSRFIAQCPSHPDRNPSLSVTGIEGRVLVYCHAGCDIDAVLAALKLTRADLYDTSKTTYVYPDGRQVHRTPSKQFYQTGNTKGRALFHVDKLGDSPLVFVVEGEQDVLAVEAAGGTAVCSAMGAGKAGLFDWSPLKNRDVIVVADKDSAGRAHARYIVGLLTGVASSVKCVEAAVGKDAADHIAANRCLSELVPINLARGADDPSRNTAGTDLVATARLALTDPRVATALALIDIAESLRRVAAPK